MKEIKLQLDLHEGPIWPNINEHPTCEDPCLCTGIPAIDQDSELQKLDRDLQEIYISHYSFTHGVAYNYKQYLHDIPSMLNIMNKIKTKINSYKGVYILDEITPLLLHDMKWKKESSYKRIYLYPNFSDGPISTRHFSNTVRLCTEIPILDNDDTLKRLYEIIYSFYASHLTTQSNENTLELKKEEINEVIRLWNSFKNRLKELEDGSFVILDYAIPYFLSQLEETN